MGHGEAECVGDLEHLGFRVTGGPQDRDTEIGERVTALFEAGQEPAAEGSPMAAVEEEDQVRRFDPVG
jgi:hypothetical protein